MIGWVGYDRLGRIWNSLVSVLEKLPFHVYSVKLATLAAINTLTD